MLLVDLLILFESRLKSGVQSDTYRRDKTEGGGLDSLRGTKGRFPRSDSERFSTDFPVSSDENPTADTHRTVVDLEIIIPSISVRIKYPSSVRFL